MRKGLWTTLAASALCFGLMALPASAGQSRTTSFTFTCDGQFKQTTVPFTGFTPNQANNVLGGRINMFQQQGGLQFVILGVSGTPNANIAILGGGGSPTDHGNNNTDTNFTNVSLPVTSDGAGVIRVDILGSCLGGAGARAGFATVYFTF